MKINNSIKYTIYLFAISIVLTIPYTHNSSSHTSLIPFTVLIVFIETAIAGICISYILKKKNIKTIRIFCLNFDAKTEVKFLLIIFIMAHCVFATTTDMSLREYLGNKEIQNMIIFSILGFILYFLIWYAITWKLNKKKS